MTGVIDTPSGQLHGIHDPSSGVTAFMGVPYAQPPIGSLRWRPPQPLKRWDGVRDATRAAARCIQHAPYGELEPGNPDMSEDCLYLNAWTPNTSTLANLPVILWIHGGEFWAGSGSEPRYNGAKLAARGAVIVTINYRLGIFGFLSHPELSAESGRDISGNYGLLDQIAALNWVRANIAAFGGDPLNITIAGESAGSCSVSALMASPLSKNLFQRALGESCAYFMPESHAMKPLTLEENERRGAEFMHACGANSLSELRETPARHLLGAWMRDVTKRMQPCFDDYVLPLVNEAFAAAREAHVPLLVGWNREEMGYMRAGQATFDANIFKEKLATGEFGQYADLLLSAYRSEDAFEFAMALAGDRTMVYPTWKWAELHARVAPTFAYQFDRAPPGSPFGAAHACEIEYVFGTLDSKPRDYGQEDRELSDCIGDYWVNFARTGNPNGAGLPKWPDYAQDKCVMHLDSNISASPLLSRARLELLDQIFAKRSAQ
jgi:para-nitrobenzyl esterase